MSYSKKVPITPSLSLNVNFSGLPTGPPIVFLHYWGGSALTFSKITTLLPNYHSIAVDFRGWGDSDGPQNADAYTIQDLAIDVETLISELDLKNFILVGHSMGGKVAQLIAGRGRVIGLKGLVLLAPAPPSPLIIPAAMKAQQMVAYSSAESSEFVVRNILASSELADEDVKMLVVDIMKGNRFAVRNSSESLLRGSSKWVCCCCIV